MRAIIIIVSLVVYFIGTNTMLAQRQFDANEKLKYLDEELDLSVEQGKGIEIILIDLQQSINDVRNNSSGERSAVKAQLIDFMAKANSKIEELLDEEQKIIFNNMVFENKEKRRGRY
jgi:hypothetical protein